MSASDQDLQRLAKVWCVLPCARECTGQSLKGCMYQARKFLMGKFDCTSLTGVLFAAARSGGGFA
jgi:hypothetical protein